MNANGVIAMSKLRKPSRLDAQATPSLPYIGSAARGSTTAKILRLNAEEAWAEAANIS